MGERRAERLLAAMRKHLDAHPHIRIDYLTIADAATLQPLQRLRGKVVMLMAVWVGRTRLIDNLLVDVS